MQQAEKRRLKGIVPRLSSWGHTYDVPRLLPNGQENPEYRRKQSIKSRRAHGVKPRSQKYGVPCILPDGTRNPEYQRARARARGIPVKRALGDNKYGIRSRLENGMKNPEYCRRADEARRRNKGMKPRQPSKYGVRYRLSNGKINPEYERRRGKARRQKNRKPKKPVGDNKMGVPKRLPDGNQNPEYQRLWRRSKGMKPIEEIRGNGRYGVPALLPNGERNPEYNRLWWRSLSGKLSRAKFESKRRRGLPTTTIIGTPFKGAHLHHMAPTLGIWVPAWVNRLIYHNIWTGQNMELINMLALEWHIQTIQLSRNSGL